MQNGNGSGSGSSSTGANTPFQSAENTTTPIPSPLSLSSQEGSYQALQRAALISTSNNTTNASNAASAHDGESTSSLNRKRNGRPVSDPSLSANTILSSGEPVAAAGTEGGGSAYRGARPPQNEDSDSRGDRVGNSLAPQGELTRQRHNDATAGMQSPKVAHQTNNEQIKQYKT